jgi:signal transduction histidine kinase
LRKQVAALQARHQLQVEAALYDEPDVSLPVKEALYRIGQEALHNTAKHARATEVRLSLARIDDDLLLEISDNGAGFDAAGSFPGHLGLHSMRERAERLGGTLAIESAAGAGTRIQVRVPCPAKKEESCGSDADK